MLVGLRRARETAPPGEVPHPCDGLGVEASMAMLMDGVPSTPVTGAPSSSASGHASTPCPSPSSTTTGMQVCDTPASAPPTPHLDGATELSNVKGSCTADLEVQATDQAIVVGWVVGHIFTLMYRSGGWPSCVHVNVPFCVRWKNDPAGPKPEIRDGQLA